jgi:predicted phosphodiesterase
MNQHTDARKIMSKYEKSLFLSDIHVPFQNNDALRIVAKFIKDFQPDYVTFLGDTTDFYAISSFNKDPARITSLQADINESIQIIKRLQKVVPDASWRFHEGNHENRLQRYMWNNPEISSLDALTVPNLLHLPELGIKYIPQNKTDISHRFVFTHGDMARKFSNYTAKAMLEKYGMSGISAHTHRAGQYYLTDASGFKSWTECGCLCDLHPEYLIGTPNWMNCFSVGWFKKRSNRYIIEQVPIVDKMAVYTGQEYKA